MYTSMMTYTWYWTVYVESITI